jgi:hypothetical protein
MAIDYPSLREVKSSKTNMMQMLTLGMIKPRCETEANNSAKSRKPKHTASLLSSSTCQVRNRDKERNCVKFCHVDIREYGRILVDHPECKDGLAIGLDWKHANMIRRIPIELFERIRRSQGRRSQKSLERLSTSEKRILLVNVGAYREETLWHAYCKSVQAQSRKITLTTGTAA